MELKQSDVPVFILAGGLGTRLSEETNLRPKPMIEIGGIPILLHIMRSYYAFGFNDFVICAGYKSFEIKRYFLDYEFSMNHIEIDHRTDSKTPPRTLAQNQEQERWRVRVIDTGLESMTGARLARAFDVVSSGQTIKTFGLTYGDGLSDVNLADELRFHQSHGQIGTVLGVKNTARYGELDVGDDNEVSGFLEKPESRQGFINGGFFFFDGKFREYLSPTPSTILEREPLSKLAVAGNLRVFKHNGFWSAMDTLRDKIQLQKLWDDNAAPWRPGVLNRKPT